LALLKGIAFPFRKREDGIPGRTIPPELYRDSILQILLTEKGERCFVAGTKIPLLNGTVKSIEEMVDKGLFWVYSIGQDNAIVPGHAQAYVTGEAKDFVDVTLDSGAAIRCTPEHRWMLRDGTYKEARSLVAGDSLMPLHRPEITKTNHKTQSVAPVSLPNPVPVYDLHVDTTHNFALADGVFVHNCMRPTFGVRLKRFLFENVQDDLVQEAIRFEVQDAIQTWEPRVTLISVLIEALEGDDTSSQATAGFIVHLDYRTPDGRDEIIIRYETPRQPEETHLSPEDENKCV